MKTEMISKVQIEKRKFWIDEIIRLSGDFGVDAEKVEDELNQEIKNNGIDSLLGIYDYAVRYQNNIAMIQVKKNYTLNIPM